MTGSALPHSGIVAEHLSDFLRSVSDEILEHSRKLANSSRYRGIFKNSLAAHATLEEFRRGELPLVKSASGIARRIPMLLICRQLSLAYVELRRFLEVVSWYPYFRDHPVEWDEFKDHPEAGVVRDTADPIRFGAHRDMAWHHAYITARYRQFAWIGGLVGELNVEYARLSTHVHAAFPSLDGSVALPFDETTEDSLKAFQLQQRRVLAGGCLLVAAAKPASLSKLPAVERAWFDWLIGNPRAKELRASKFGAASRTSRRR